MSAARYLPAGSNEVPQVVQGFSANYQIFALDAPPKSFIQATTQDSITSQTIAVEHIRISSGRSFVEVRRKLEGTVPKLDSGIAEALRSGDQKRAKDYEENGPKLSIFGERDHGALLQIVGNRRNAVQYEIGNPLTASLGPIAPQRFGRECERAVADHGDLDGAELEAVEARLRPLARLGRMGQGGGGGGLGGAPEMSSR